MSVKRKWFHKWVGGVLIYFPAMYIGARLDHPTIFTPMALLLSLVGFLLVMWGKE